MPQQESRRHPSWITQFRAPSSSHVFRDTLLAPWFSQPSRDRKWPRISSRDSLFWRWNTWSSTWIAPCLTSVCKDVQECKSFLHIWSPRFLPSKHRQKLWLFSDCHQADFDIGLANPDQSRPYSTEVAASELVAEPFSDRSVLLMFCLVFVSWLNYLVVPYWTFLSLAGYLSASV